MARRTKATAAPPDAPDAPDQQPTSDPVLDAEQALGTALAIVARSLADPGQRIVRRKLKVDGVWYQIEVARP